MTAINDDEIDLFELFQTLWEGKWLISAVTAIAILAGGGFLVFQEPAYGSKLVYSVDTIPPFYEGQKASSDFQKKFYSASVFENWKNSGGNKSLIFDDISTTISIDGIILTKDEQQLLATLAPEKTGSSAILVKTNQLDVLNDLFSYANHINNLLKQEYVMRSEEELTIIETRFNDLTSADNSIAEILLSIDRFIVSANAGANVFDIQRPTMPKKVSPKSSLILALSVVLGGMVGVLFVLVRNAIHKRKAQLAES